MSGHGAPVIAIPSCRWIKVAIVASSWHNEVMDGLIAGAQQVCDAAGATSELVRVPGAFELPIVAAAVAARPDVKVIVALGVVIRGGTPHFDYVCQAATTGLSKVASDSKKPVGFGLLTCDNEQQALDRAGLAGSIESKGEEAAIAALQTYVTIQNLLES